jgi:hypothetical protein
MRQATLVSAPSTNQGTFGILTLDDGTKFHTGELPWHDNQHGISCIPGGTYICKPIESPKHGKCYQVMDVPGRNMIEIHAANWMGDAPLKKQLEGCIALGEEVSILDGQMAVTRSKKAVQDFEDNLKWDDLELTIVRN